MSSKRFRIALSFAGEKRKFVGQVATILAKEFGEEKILYDKFHEAEFANAELAFDLPALYKDESDLVVSVICPNYDQKEWCGLEWRAIISLIKEKRSVDVMLTRFEHVDGKGLFGLAGFVELDHKTPEEVAMLIIQSLRLNERKAKNQHIDSEAMESNNLTTSIPNNLPRIHPLFGREKELAIIRERIDPCSTGWGASIFGVGGIGKTALAVQIASECLKEHFDVVIFVSVHDREMDDDGERSIGNLLIRGFLEMLNEIGREIGITDVSKLPEGERIRRLLDELRSRRALLILDNLESFPKRDRDELYTFVTRLPRGCKAILTSRRSIGSGSEVIPLEGLDKNAAFGLLTELIQHNKLLSKTTEGERIDLWRSTGGNPLLLRWLTGQVGRGSCRNFADALAFLSTCPAENDPLEFIFHGLAKDFTAKEEAVLGALTYFAVPAKVADIAVVSGLVEHAAVTVLNALANRFLINPDREETEYSIVPMLPDFLRRRRGDMVSEIGNRLEQRAYKIITEGGFEKTELFPVLEGSWQTVAPALPLFTGGSYERLKMVCNALSKFLHYTGRWDEWLALNEHAEQRAVSAGDYLQAGLRAIHEGYIHEQRRDGDSILACAGRAAAHWETANASAGQRADAVRLRGVGYRLNGNIGEAIRSYREALELDRRRSPESERLTMSLNGLANAELYACDFNSADGNYREALQIATKIRYKEGVALATGNLAGLELRRQDWSRAHDLAYEALQLSVGIGRQDLIATNYHRLAMALGNLGMYPVAVTFAQRAVELYARLGSPMLQAAQQTLQECEGRIP